MEPTETKFAAFDDPALKAAVVRAWGWDRAPDSLRARLSAMRLFAAGRPATADDEAVTDDSRPAVIGAIRPNGWQRPMLRYGLAAAAMVLLGFGLAYRLDDTPFGRDGGSGLAGFGPGGGEMTFASTVPPAIAQGLLESHDRCSKTEGHNVYPELAPTDFASVRRKLENHLGFPVLAGNVEEALGRNGWRFKGAAVCNIGDIEAAHLVFVRNGQAISIFSLPRSTCRRTDGQPRECEDPNPDHPVAVFVWSDGVHCVVGSSTDRSLSVDQVRAVLSHLRPTLPAPSPR